MLKHIALPIPFVTKKAALQGTPAFPRMLVCLDRAPTWSLQPWIDALVKSRAASVLPDPDGAALLSERHVVTGWKVHSFTVSCHSAHTELR